MARLEDELRGFGKMLFVAVALAGTAGCFTERRELPTMPSANIENSTEDKIYGLINKCCDKARGNKPWNASISRELARGLGYTNQFSGMAYLSYDEGNAKLSVDGKKVFTVSEERMIIYSRK